MKKYLLPLLVAVGLVTGGILLIGGGKPAPTARFTLISGDALPLEALRGKVVLVNFWATSCPSCIKEMPQLVETYRRYQPRGLETVAVAMSYDPADYVKTYAAKNALPFKVALDTDGANAQAFGGVRLTPTTFVLDQEGRVVRQFLGEPDFTELHRLLESLLK